MYNAPLKILVVEDNPGDFVLVREYLEETLSNASIVHAQTLREALEVLDKYQLDVILLDLSLPDSEGIKSFREISLKAWQVPVIVLTGMGDTELALETVKHGAQDYIVKDDTNPALLAKSIQYSIERRKIFEHLKRSEEQYKHLFNSNPLPMWAFNINTYQFLMVNQAAILHYGYNEKEFLNMTVQDISVRGSAAILKKQIEEIKHGDGIQFINDWIHRKKNNQLIDVELVRHTIVIEGQEAVLTVIHDVTEQKKAKEQLRESEQMFRTISENFPNGAVAILDKDLKYQYTAGKEFYVSDVDSSYFNNTIFTDHFSPTVQQTVKENLEKVFEGNNVVFEASDDQLSYMISAAPLYEQDNSINKIVLASQNISRQKEALKRVHFQSNILERLTGFVVLADNDYNFTYFNNGAEVLFGNQIKDLYGKRITNMFLASFKETAEHALTSAFADKEVEIELKCLNASLREIWVSVTFSKMYDEEDIPIGILCMGKDISIEKQLTLERQRFFEVSIDLMSISDFQGYFKQLNHEWETTFGLTRDELLASPMSKLVHPDDRESSIKMYTDMIENRKDVLNFENRYVTKSGETRYLSWNSKVDMDNGLVYSLARDITRQKEEEQQLRLLESVITNTNDAIIITEAKPSRTDGNPIVYVNRAFSRMTGYQAEEVIGKTTALLRGPKSDDNELQKLREAQKKGEACEIEIVNYKKDKTEFWCHFTLVPVADKDGVYTNWISVQRDISNRKRNESEKEMLIEELTRTNTDLRQFSYITSHNLRAPLSNLLGIIQLLDVSTITDPMTSLLIKNFKDSTLQLNETVNDLINVLIIKNNVNAKKEKLDLTRIFEKVIKSVQNMIEQYHVKINTDFSEANELEINGTYLESILLNLLTNAIKYRSENLQPQLNIYTRKYDDNIKLYFSDNGLGIDLNRYRDRIFGLYQRFHDHSDSKGLGLYIINSQIRAMGGSIDVESQVGEGTTFIVTFKK